MALEELRGRLAFYKEALHSIVTDVYNFKV